MSSGPVDPDFRRLFESAPGLYLILDPGLRIVAATDAYLAATMTKRDEIVGRGIFEVFPDNPDDDEATGERNLRESLERVLERGRPDAMAVQQYDVQPPGDPDAPFETRYWSPINSPVLDDHGRLVYILHSVEDVTEYVRQQEAESEQSARMQAEILRRSADLQRANTELRAASQAKNDFLSRMSHELRTPLNAILGFAQVLELDPLTSDQQSNVRDILRGGWHLLDLINEILDISRIESGMLGISLEPVMVGDATHEALSLVRPLADNHRIELRREASDLYERHVLADRQRLRQVLLNLLSNAIKYNDEGGHVTVSIAERDGWTLRISVTDDGSGIPEDLHDRVFAPFDRAGAEGSSIDGTGLGLALARGLVETMGGSLGLESVVGLGSTFNVDLLAAIAPSDDQEVVALAAGADELLPPCKMLVIEDNVANVKLIERVLKHDPQVDLIAAMQGTLGLELAREHAPDLVVLDVHLPDMSGREVLRRLQDDDSTREIPVVVLSADATDGQVTRMLAAGAHAYLTKPLNIKRFREVVREVLAIGDGA